MPNGKKSSQRMFLVKVSGIDGYFQTKSGGDITAEASKIYDGGANTPDVMSAPKEVAEVTVARAYDRFRDGDLLRSLRNLVGEWFTDVSVTDTDEKLVAYGKPVTYTGALLTGLKELETDSNSGEPTSFELTFTPSAVV